MILSYLPKCKLCGLYCTSQKKSPSFHASIQGKSAPKSKDSGKLYNVHNYCFHHQSYFCCLYCGKFVTPKKYHPKNEREGLYHNSCFHRHNIDWNTISRELDELEYELYNDARTMLVGLVKRSIPQNKNLVVRAAFVCLLTRSLPIGKSIRPKEHFEERQNVVLILSQDVSKKENSSTTKSESAQIQMSYLENIGPLFKNNEEKVKSSTFTPIPLQTLENDSSDSITYEMICGHFSILVKNLSFILSVNDFLVVWQMTYPYARVGPIHFPMNELKMLKDQDSFFEKEKVEKIMSSENFLKTFFLLMIEESHDSIPFATNLFRTLMLKEIEKRKSEKKVEEDLYFLEPFRKLLVEGKRRIILYPRTRLRKTNFVSVVIYDSVVDFYGCGSFVFPGDLLRGYNFSKMTKEEKEKFHKKKILVKSCLNIGGVLFDFGEKSEEIVPRKIVELDFSRWGYGEVTGCFGIQGESLVVKGKGKNIFKASMCRNLTKLVKRYNESYKAKRKRKMIRNERTCQDFVDDGLRHVLVETDHHVDYFLSLYGKKQELFKNLKREGLSELKLTFGPDFKEAFEFSYDEITFETHEELDKFATTLTQVFSAGEMYDIFTGEWKILKAIDRVFWWRHILFPEVERYKPHECPFGCPVDNKSGQWKEPVERYKKGLFIQAGITIEKTEEEE